MEVKFNKNMIHCLRQLHGKIHTQEQTLEIRLPDAYPDIGKILACWGQVLVSGKEWRGPSVGISLGVMSWVLYAPEDGTQPRVVEAWIPMQCRWDLPQDEDDGVIHLRSVLASLDGRGISARKIMLRACVDTYAQLMVRQASAVAVPPVLPEDVQLRTQAYPAQLPVEAGEKQVQIEDRFGLPGSLPPIHKIVHYSLSPAVTEQKVIGNRLVFRGQCILDLSYMTEDGGLQNWQAEIPFSQFVELDRDYGSEATPWVVPLLTAMDMELVEGQLHLRCGLAAQYTIFDKMLIEVVEDAFSPVRSVSLVKDGLALPLLLDKTEVTVPASAEISSQAQQILFAWATGEYPVIHLGENGTQVRITGQFETLIQNEEGQLSGESVRFENAVPFQSAADNQIQLWMGQWVQPENMPMADGYSLRTAYPITALVYSGQSIPMITQLELGEVREPDGDRPSVILCRADEDGLWGLAKRCSSTVAAIQEANRLSGEPELGQMLLIPVC